MGCYTSESQKQNWSVIIARQSLHPAQPGQAEARADTGRYTLNEAAEFISEQTNEHKEAILQKLANAAGFKTLATYAPGSCIKYECINNNALSAMLVCASYEEVYWSDLNEWLEKNEPLLVCKFPNPDTAPAAKVEARQGTSPSSDNWKANARLIGKEIFNEKQSLNIEQIAEKTHEEMVNRKNNGEPSMTGRGNRVPSAGTIKRHALTGIKA